MPKPAHMSADDWKLKRAEYRLRYRVKANLQLKSWRQKNPEKAREIEKRHYAKRRDGILARRRELYATDPDRRLKHKLGNLRWHYGISKEDYELLLKEQEGLCAICGRPPSHNGRKKALHVDHDHLTDEVRGLLCGNCNSALGLIEESHRILSAMTAYLEKWNAKISGSEAEERISR